MSRRSVLGLQIVVLVEQRTFRVRDREIGRDRIGILALADSHAAVAVAAASRERRKREREQRNRAA